MKPPRRWLRFSLSTFLVLVLAVAVEWQVGAEP